MDDFKERLADGYDKVMKAISEGGMEQEALIFLILIAALAVGIFLISLLKPRSQKKREQLEGFDRTAATLGKLEKLEQNHNTFRTEVLREVERVKLEFGKVKDEVRDLRQVVKYAQSGKARPSGFLRKPKEGEAEERDDSDDTLEGLLNRGVEDLGSEPVWEEVPAQPKEKPEAKKAPPPEDEDSTVVLKETATLAARLKSTRQGFMGRVRSLFRSKTTVDQATLDELEEVLVGADLGVATAQALIEEVRRDLESGQDIDQGIVEATIKIRLLKILEKGSPLNPEILPDRRDNDPLVVLMVGVNGVGKTTTAAKLAGKWKEAGARVMMVAADTFRAAAVEQLKEWGQRLSVPVVSGAAEAKPSTVVFDALERAKAEEIDVVLIDTAGRLHTKSNLMQELEGIRNVAERHFIGAPHEVILVVDGSTGQNALSQAKEFNEAVNLTGLVVTKLDGTPKGGVVVAIKNELGIPVRYIGVGERPEDLRPFVARDFVEALFVEHDTIPPPVTDDGGGRDDGRGRRDTAEYSTTKAVR